VLKPVSDARFALALDRARRAHLVVDGAALAARLERVLAAHRGRANPPSDAAPPRYASRVVVRVGRRDIVVATDEIDWVEADGYCAVLHHGGRRYTVRQSLQTLQEQLDPTRFLRVHRSAIVRVDFVAALHHLPGAGIAVVLRDGRRVAVSRSRQANVLRTIGAGR
jgi:two-component system LytT family response regulator